jgi:CheY-like chemotaxis protein
MKQVGHVLVVDDQCDTRELVSELIRAEGYLVLEAENGKVALELLVADAEHEPSLIILDLEMPVMTGWEFLSIVRNDSRLSCIPVLVTSGSCAYLHERALSTSVGFLRKPYAVEALLAKISLYSRRCPVPPGSSVERKR